MTSAVATGLSPTTRLAVSSVLGAFAMGVLALALAFPEGPPHQVPPVVNAMVGCTYLALAGIILWRRPGETLGRVILGMALVMFVGALGQIAGMNLGLAESDRLDGVGAAIYLILGMCFGLLVHLFPTGQPPSLAWRWPIRLLQASTAFLALGQLLGVDPTRNLGLTIVAGALSAGYAVGLLSSVPSLVFRYRRSRDTERAQVKWFLFAVVFAIVGWFIPTFWGALLAATLPQVAITVALTRYRLFDIDRIISRTASYTIVTGMLLVTYAVIVTTATRLLPDLNTLAVASATLAAAALARPLLRRVQQVVDRRFNRSRYDAERTVNAFVGRLATQVSPPLVLDDLQRVVMSTLEPARTAVWTQETP